MAIARVCSEDGVSLAGRHPQTKTCSVKCRQARARRLRKESAEVQRDGREQTSYTARGLKPLMDSINGQTLPAIREAVVDELRPIVREAITEDVLRAIQGMVNLTPRAIDLLGEDMESEDPQIRQKAYSLLVKYTIGHPALVKNDDADGSKQIVVNFALDRPDPTQLADAESEVTEMRTCDLCDQEKPATEFVGSSERCMDCQTEWKQRIADEFG